MPARRLILIYSAAFLRSMSIGLLGVVLAVYLSRLGYSSTLIGVVLAAGLAGGTVATAFSNHLARRLGTRQVLIGAALFSAVGGIGLALLRSPAAMVPLAFASMLNGMGTDRSASFAIEQAIIPSLVGDERRTWALSWYNVALDTSGALGALSGALPVLLQRWAGLDLLSAYRWIFGGYAVVNLACSVLYAFLDRHAGGTDLAAVPEVSRESKRIVRKIALLFALDSTGGGFLADALLAYWFFHRFGVDEKQLGLLFFVVRVFNALSHLGAAWLARRIGLVNTMVFTHLPSSIFLLFVPLAPSFKLAAILLLAREALVEMDVPTRQSYVAAMVAPHERVYASSLTNVSRTGAWAVSSSLAGVLMQHVAFSAPLLLGGSLKILYDGLLYRSFRHLKPPEER
ncbi:MAG TPA: MFS transporter [Terriglobales bacterium]|nr:MFS transporter [Terriglobales bacterium]